MKRIFLTGANRGLGLALTQTLLARGDRVWAACRSPEAAEALQALKAQFAETLTLVACNVGNLESIETAYVAVSAETDALDWVVNNAGVGGLETLGEVDLGRGARYFMINAVAPIVVARTFLSLLRKGVRPAVIQMSSTTGSVATKENEDGRWIDGYVYPGTKAGLNLMSRQLAKDLRPAGVTVINQSPGWVRTDMGGEAAPLSAEGSAAAMIAIWDTLKLEDSGKFLSEEGEPLAYG